MYKNFILFAIPMVLAALLSQAYDIINTVVAGKYIGESGLAAIGATSSAYVFVSSLFWGAGSAFTVYIARLFGSGRYAEMKQMIFSFYAFMAALLVAVSALLLIFKAPIFKLLNVDAEILNDTAKYYDIMVLGLAVIRLNYYNICIMHSLGISSYPFWMTLISSLLNIFGGIFNITVLKTGVEGIAAATVLSTLFVFVLSTLKIFRCFKELKVANVKFKFDKNVFIYMKQYALPGGAQQGIMYLASLVLSPIVNGIGASATAAYTVVMKIYNINSAIYQESSKTFTNFAAQCAGSGKFDMIKKGLKFGIFQSGLFLLPALAVCTAFARPVCAAFFPDGYTGEAFGLAVRFLAVYLPFIVINLFNNIFHGLFRALGTMRFLVLSTLIGTVSRIITSFVLVAVLGMEGVYIGWVVSWAAEILFSAFAYYKYFGTTQKLKIMANAV